MLNRNGLKCIKLPNGVLKTTEGSETSSTYFEVTSSKYVNVKPASQGYYYMGLFNDSSDLGVDTYSLENETLIQYNYSAISYYNDASVDATNIVTLTRTITNNTNEDFVINTIGIIFCASVSPRTYGLMSCERIPTITVKPGETYTFTHKIKID